MLKSSFHALKVSALWLVQEVAGEQKKVRGCKLLSLF